MGTVLHFLYTYFTRQAKFTRLFAQRMFLTFCLKIILCLCLSFSWYYFKVFFGKHGSQGEMLNPSFFPPISKLNLEYILSIQFQKHIMYTPPPWQKSKPRPGPPMLLPPPSSPKYADPSFHIATFLQSRLLKPFHGSQGRT